MIVHNEDDEDQDIKDLFQKVFKPFWAAVPVVSGYWTYKTYNIMLASLQYNLPIFHNF